jgi:hypothetical protein
MQAGHFRRIIFAAVVKNNFSKKNFHINATKTGVIHSKKTAPFSTNSKKM